MKTIAEIVVPACGIYSFPLPHPDGAAPANINVDGRHPIVSRLTDNVLHVRGVASPGPKSVTVDGPRIQSDPPLYTEKIFRMDYALQTFEAENGKSFVMSDGIRISTWIEQYGDSALIYIEWANAEFNQTEIPGPVELRPTKLTVDGNIVDFPDVRGVLNPREHTCRVVGVGPQGEALRNMRHRIQCQGEWSYQTIPAWGPQKITIQEPVTTMPTMPRVTGIQGSPLKPMGYPGGQETGGHMIEPCLLPATNHEGIMWLTTVMLRTMDREPLWAYTGKGGPCTDRRIAAIHGGEAPYRLTDTNHNLYGKLEPWDDRVRSQAMPEFHMSNWKPGHVGLLEHGFRPHDGQHFVRATAAVKSMIWNACDPYAIHCMDQLAAHATLVRTSEPCRDEGWGYENSVFDMLNRFPSSRKGKGFGIGRREDAWMLETIVMGFMVKSRADYSSWLQRYRTVVEQNILPNGLGNQRGNSKAESTAKKFAPQNGMKEIQFEDGAGFFQTYELEHYIHALYCMSRIPSFSALENHVVQASLTIGSSHRGSPLKAAPWVIQTMDPGGEAVTNVTRGQGQYIENWYGMVIHSYAHRLNPSGPHRRFLTELYGPGLNKLPKHENYEIGRAQTMSLLLDVEPPVVIAPPVVVPDPPVVVPELERLAALLESCVEQNQILQQQQEALHQEHANCVKNLAHAEQKVQTLAAELAKERVERASDQQRFLDFIRITNK